MSRNNRCEIIEQIEWFNDEQSKSLSVLQGMSPAIMSIVPQLPPPIIMNSGQSKQPLLNGGSQFLKLTLDLTPRSQYGTYHQQQSSQQQQSPYETQRHHHYNQRQQHNHMNVFISMVSKKKLLYYYFNAV